MTRRLFARSPILFARTPTFFGLFVRTEPAPNGGARLFGPHAKTQRLAKRLLPQNPPRRERIDRATVRIGRADPFGGRDVFWISRAEFRIARDVFRIGSERFRIGREVFRVGRKGIRIGREVFRIDRARLRIRRVAFRTDVFSVWSTLT